MNAVRKVWFGLGSNLGDSLAHLQSAVDAVMASDLFHDVAVSTVWRSSPVGGAPQPDYLNAVMQVRTGASASQLLTFIQECERARGRIREERWGPRTLDVDIIAIEGEFHDTESFQVPHPRALERGFVVVPLSELVDPAQVLGHGFTTDTDGLEPTELALVVDTVKRKG